MSDLTAEWMSNPSDAWHEQASPFLLQRADFCEAVASPLKPMHLVIKRQDRIIATCSFIERRRRGLTEWLSPLFASFGGVRCPEAQSERDPSKRERAWREVLEALSRAVPPRIDHVEVIFAPGDVDVRPLVWSGWTARPHYNYVSRWTRDGEWQSALSSSARRQWRKAVESGLTAQILEAEDTTELRALWSKMATRQRLDGATARHLEGLGTWLGRSAFGFQVRVGPAEGSAQAMALLGFDAHRVYYLAGASDPATLGSGAPTLLHAAILEQIEARGLPRCYDWVGANTPGIAQFKRGFGPELEVLMAVRRQGWKRRLLDTAGDWWRRRPTVPPAE